MCRATLEFYFVSKKSRRRSTAQTESLLLILFIPRPEWSVQLFSALCIGTDYETTAAWNQVLSKTECEGKRFTRDNLNFLTRVLEFSLNKVLFCGFFFQMCCGLVVSLAPSELEYLHS